MCDFGYLVIWWGVCGLLFFGAYVFGFFICIDQITWLFSRASSSASINCSVSLKNLWSLVFFYIGTVQRLRIYTKILLLLWSVIWKKIVYISQMRAQTITTPELKHSPLTKSVKSHHHQLATRILYALLLGINPYQSQTMAHLLFCTLCNSLRDLSKATADAVNVAEFWSKLT